MISVLGLPLAQASVLLEQSGVSVTALEVRSKKGVEGETEARVIRQDYRNETSVTLIYAAFRMKPNEANA